MHWKSRQKKITVFMVKSTFFWQINVFIKEVSKELISWKFLSEIAFSQRAAWKNKEFTLTEKFFVKSTI